MAIPLKYQAKEVLNKVLNTAEDALNVDLTAGASAILVDDAAFTPGTSSVQMVGAEFDDGSPDSVDEGDAGAVRMSGRRELYTQIRDSAGGEVGAQVVTDNATASATPNVLLTGAHYKDALDTYADNDAAPLHVNSKGSLLVNLHDGSNALVMQAAAGETEDEDTNAITSVSTVYGFDSEGSSNSKLRALQVAADNAGLSTAPNVLVSGGIYKAALDTYADNDASPLHFDVNGRLIVGGSTAHDAAVAGNPLLSGYEAKTLDGSALPNTVNAEGDIVRAASTLSGVAYNNLVVVDGSESAISEHDVAIGSGLGTAGVVNLYESKVVDASAFPNNVNAEGDMVRPAASLNGVQYIMPVSANGSKTPMATDDSGQVATPEILNVGGEYRASATTYADGDATILQSDVTGGLKVSGSAVEDAAAAGNPVLAGGRYDSPGNDNATVRSLDDNDAGALALDPTGALYVREHLGSTGSCFVSGTNAVTAAIGKFVAIQFLEDTVFNGSSGLVATDSGRWPDDTDAAADISSSNTAAVGSQVFPQGMTIFGRWDSFILASGAVIAYVGNV